jgi:diguanylate cyclase (GGDEF)-like protein
LANGSATAYDVASVTLPKKPNAGGPAQQGRDSDLPPPTIPALGDDMPIEREETITDKVAVYPHLPIRDQATLTMLTGNSAGRVYKLQQEKTVLGRGKTVDIKVVDNGVSREHARIIRWVGMAFVVEDLGSMNGTYINGRKVERAPIQSGDRVQLGPSAQLRFALTDSTESRLQEKLYSERSRDPATDVYSREHMLRQMRLELAYARRHDSDVSIVLVAIEGYAEMLRTRGDEFCAELIHDFAGRIADCGRIEDLVARYSDSMLAVLLRTTSIDSAILYARRALERSNQAGYADGVTLELRMGIAAMSELPNHTRPEDFARLAELRVEHASKHADDPICAHTKDGR